MQTAEEWFYTEGDERHGPVARERLIELVREGRVRPRTLVWSEGMSEWIPFSRSPLAPLAEGTATPPPIPPRREASGGPWEARTRPFGGEDGGPAPSMGFGEAIRYCLSNYVTFAGRGSRSEFWYFWLFALLVQFAAGVLDTAFFGADAQVFNAIATLGLFLPLLAAGVRRLHDTDRSGWWILIGLVPIVGWIVLLIFYVQRGTPGPNRFG